MTHICVGNLTIIGSDNGLSPGRCQAITWANVGILLIGPLGTNFSEIWVEIHTFSFKKIHLKMSSGKWRPFCLGLNVLSDANRDKLWQVCFAVTLHQTLAQNGKYSSAIDSSTSDRCGSNFTSTTFKLNTQNSSLGTHTEISPRWIPQNLTNELPSATTN